MHCKFHVLDSSQGHKEVWNSGSLLHTFLTWALGGGQSASSLVCLTYREKCTLPNGYEVLLDIVDSSRTSYLCLKI